MAGSDFFGVLCRVFDFHFACLRLFVVLSFFCLTVFLFSPLHAQGSHLSRRAGFWRVVFDNTYSVFTGKDLQYTLTVAAVPPEANGDVEDVRPAAAIGAADAGGPA